MIAAVYGLSSMNYLVVQRYAFFLTFEMLKQYDLPLKNLAEICGFKNLGAFSTFFKQVYGKTPTEWRDKE